MKKTYITYAEMQGQVQDIIRQMQVDNWKPDYIVGLTRGGLIPAVMISQYLGVPMHALGVSLRDSEIGPESNCWMAEDAFGYVNEDEQATMKSRWDISKRKNILIVDDINDTGATINWVRDDWQSGCFPNESDVWSKVWENTTRFAVLYNNEASDAIINPTYVSQEINKHEDNAWLVFPWEEWWKG